FHSSPGERAGGPRRVRSDAIEVADLRRPQAMAVGDQDHGRVAMPIAAMLSSAVHQPLDLAVGEGASLDCPVFDAWGAFLGCRFHAGKPCLRVMRAALPPRTTWSISSCATRLAAGDRRADNSCRLQRAWPPVGGTFYFEILVTAPLPKTCPKMVLSHKGVAFV